MIQAQIKEILKVPRRGLHEDPFSEFMQKKNQNIANLEVQAKDALERGNKAEARKLKNKMASYRSRMKTRARLEQVQMRLRSIP